MGLAVAALRQSSPPSCPMIRGGLVQGAGAGGMWCDEMAGAAGGSWGQGPG